MPSFLPTNPSTEEYWRGIVLLGKNVATYKLAGDLPVRRVGRVRVCLPVLSRTCEAVEGKRRLSDKFGHSGRVILRGSCKCSDSHFSL
jgi:hypothetical protein